MSNAPNTTPEAEAIKAMETPVTLTTQEMIDARYSYDLPNNEAGSESQTVKDNAAVNTAGVNTSGTASADTSTDAPEEASQSEIPGDPRPPHQMQPPTKDEY